MSTLEADAEEAKRCRNISDAARDGLEGAVRHFLKEDPTRAKKADASRQTPLHWAAANGHESIVELLLQHGADAGAKDYDGNTALHWAAWYGHDSTVALLLQHGADVTAKDRDGKEPVDVATTNKIKALLRKAEEEQRQQRLEKKEVAQCKDILDAAEKGLVKAAEHFLRRDPKCMEAKDADGLAALHVAAKHGHASLVETLLGHNAALEAKDGFGQTSLHWAACCCHVRIVELLAREGAVLDAEEEDGLTPAKLAKQEGHEDVARLLQELEATKREEQADAEEAATCKGGIIQAAREGLSGALRHFLKDPESMKQKDTRSGKTALHLAAEKGHDSIVQALLANGAAVDSRTNDGRAPLHFAAANGHTSIVQLLVSQGATADATGNSGKTPADAAEANGHKEIAELLQSGNAGHLVRQRRKDSKEQKPGEIQPVEDKKLKPASECKDSQSSQSALGQSPSAPLLAGAAGPALLKVKAEAIEIPDGTEAPISMFSARFDGGPIEMKFREVHRLLTDHNFKSLMVSAGGSDDFGVMTLKCLGEVQSKGGIMIAVCTQNYGEMTSSPYSSNAELRFAFDEKVKVLPLKVADVYPPQPPGGPGHPFDSDDTAKTLCKMVFKGSVVFLDCREKSAREIAAMIAHALLKK